MSESTHRSEFSLLYIYEVAKKYLWYIALVVGLSALLAVILTMPFFYPPEYLASAVVYPTSAERFDVINLFHEEPNMYLYGGAKEVEKLDNIANSESVRMHVINALDLWSVYGINKDDAGSSPKFYVLSNYAGNVTTTRIAGNGLRIEAYDTDPQRAADIVNLVIEQLDIKNKDMLNQNKARMLDLYSKGLKQLSSELAVLTDSLRRVRSEHAVFRSLTQSEVMAEQILIAQGEYAAAKARYSSTKNYSDQLDMRAGKAKVDAMTLKSSGSRLTMESFQEGMDQVKNLEDVCEWIAKDIENTIEKQQFLRTMDLTHYSTLLVHEKAEAMDKKARPVRWIILVATVLIASLVSVIGAVLLDNILAILAKRKA
ncbi:MAG: Wzz/FepE/Etk N-terminal domain-containing protein [Bacteroidota bacterium]